MRVFEDAKSHLWNLNTIPLIIKDLHFTQHAVKPADFSCKENRPYPLQIQGLIGTQALESRHAKRPPRQRLRPRGLLFHWEFYEKWEFLVDFLMEDYAVFRELEANIATDRKNKHIFVESSSLSKHVLGVE